MFINTVAASLHILLLLRVPGHGPILDLVLYIGLVCVCVCAFAINLIRHSTNGFLKQGPIRLQM